MIKISLCNYREPLIQLEFSYRTCKSSDYLDYIELYRKLSNKKHKLDVNDMDDRMYIADIYNNYIKEDGQEKIVYGSYSEKYDLPEFFKIAYKNLYKSKIVFTKLDDVTIPINKYFKNYSNLKKYIDSRAISIKNLS